MEKKQKTQARFHPSGIGILTAFNVFQGILYLIFFFVLLFTRPSTEFLSHYRLFDYILAFLPLWASRAVTAGIGAFLFFSLAWGVWKLKVWAYWGTALIVGSLFLYTLMKEEYWNFKDFPVVGILLLLLVLWQLLRRDTRAAFFKKEEGAE